MGQIEAGLPYPEAVARWVGWAPEPRFGESKLYLQSFLFSPLLSGGRDRFDFQKQDAIVLQVAFRNIRPEERYLFP